MLFLNDSSPLLRESAILGVRYTNTGDIYHSFAVKRRNVKKFKFSTYHPTITPKFRALRGDPCRKNLHFLKLEESSFQTTYEPQL